MTKERTATDSRSNGNQLRPDPTEIRRAIDVLFEPGDVVEIREFKTRRCAISGYYDNLDKLATDAVKINRAVGGVYITLNRINPDLLSRRANRYEEYADTTTADQQVIRRRWFPIDLDPKRPAGISASDAEHAAAIEMARRVRTFLVKELGWPEPLAADSGNGAHLLFRIDLPNDADASELVQFGLQTLDQKFSDGSADVDTGNYNSARIWKLYGSVAGKGDSTTARPHRLSRILTVPESIEVVPVEKLRDLAAMAMKSENVPSTPGTRQRDGRQVGNGTFDLDSWISSHNLDVTEPQDWKEGRKWVFGVCPWNSEHTNRSAFIIQQANGAIAAGCHHNGCQDKGWHDLRNAVEPDWRDKRHPNVSSVSSVSGHAPEFWPAPRPLPNELPPVAEFDVGLLPERLRPWILDIAQRMQCPTDFPAVAAMIGLAGLVGRKIGVRPKRHDDWMVVPNLWGACIGRPGIMKTPAIQEPMKPLKQLEIKAKGCFDEEQKQHAAAKIVADQRKKVAEQSIRKAIKDGKDDPDAIARDLVDEQEDVPTRQRYLINDSTVEKLGEILNENANGVICYRDELIGLLRSLDKQGQEAARAFYLESWNGTGRFTYDRIGRGTIDIEAAIVSVIGAIQPGPLQDYLRSAADSGKGDDGLMQRLQLAVWPDVSRDWENVDVRPDPDVTREAYDVFQRLDQLNPDEIGAVQDDRESDIPFLHFTDPAQEVFDIWRASLEKKVRSGEEHLAIESHLAKYRSLIPSLALLIHLADGKYGNIGVQPLKKAIEWGKYLETHARRIFSSAVNGGVRAAWVLAKKIRSNDLDDGFSLRDVYRPCWSGLATRDDASAAVEILIDLHWLVKAEQPTNGATRTAHLINPKILSKAKEGTDKADKRPSEPPLSVMSVSDQGNAKFLPSGGDIDPDDINRLLDQVDPEDDVIELTA